MRPFVAEYDGSGEPLDLQTFPSSGDAFIGGLQTDRDGAMVLTGSFHGTVDFGHGTLASMGEQDAFVAKICR